MSTLFLSHSQHDPNVDIFRKVADSMSIDLLCMEFEALKDPKSIPIIDKIQSSNGLILLMSNEIMQRKHTINWVSFETGIGAGHELPIAVCYPVTLTKALLKHSFILIKGEFDFVVPFYNIQIQFPIDQIKGLPSPEVYIKEFIFKSYPWRSNDIREKVDLAYQKLFGTITCNNPNCKLSYIVGRISDKFQCMCCGNDIPSKLLTRLD